jgi:hypothetical protein
VSNDKVNELRDELLGCGLANQEPDMVECVRRPWNQYQDSDEDGTDGVSIPSYTTTNNRHGQAKGVDDNVIAMVNEEDVHGRITTEDEAVDAQRTLREDYERLAYWSKRCGISEGLTGNADEDDWDDVKALGVLSSGSKCPTRFDLDHVSKEAMIWVVGLTMSWIATVVIKQQNMIIPIVSIRVRPTGYL